MAFGLEVFNSAGTKIYDMSAEGGLFLGSFSVPATGSDVVQTYGTEATNKTVVVAPMGTTQAFGGSSYAGADLSMCNCVITYPAGVPTITATPGGRASTVYVFVQ